MGSPDPMRQALFPLAVSVRASSASDLQSVGNGAGASRRLLPTSSRLRRATSAFCFLLAVLGLALNERRSVRALRTLLEARDSVQPVPCTPLAENQGRLVSFSCMLTDLSTLRDGEFGVVVTAVALTRHVEVLQWFESPSACGRRRLQRANCTGVAYSRLWSERHIPSAAFLEPGHENPDLPLQPLSWRADALHAGGFLLPAPLAARLQREADVPFTQTRAVCGADRSTDAAGHCRWTAADGGLYLSAHSGGSEAPQVGDARVTWRKVAAAAVSALGVQSVTAEGETTLSSFSAGGDSEPLLFFEEGVISADEMLEAARVETSSVTWLGRIICSALLFFALGRLLPDAVVMFGGQCVDPTSLRHVLADMLVADSSAPAALGSLGVASAVGAAYWLGVRPATGGPLLCVSLACVVAIVFLGDKARKAREGKSPRSCDEAYGQA